MPKVPATSPPAPATPAKPREIYQPTDAERAAIESYMTQKRARRPAPRLTVQTRGAVTEVNVSHPEPPLAQVLLMAALGTTDQAFVDGILAQLGNAAMHGGKLEAKALNSMLAMVKGIEPKDELESMLGAQMAAVHAATMTMAGRLNHADTLAQQDSAAAALTKLTRTFGHQLEALRRYRGGAEQTVKVMHQHVNVSGAGAVVGVKAEGGGGDDKS